MHGERHGQSAEDYIARPKVRQETGSHCWTYLVAQGVRSGDGGVQRSLGLSVA